MQQYISMDYLINSIVGDENERVRSLNSYVTFYLCD
jgi:hypothetical protein